MDTPRDIARRQNERTQILRSTHAELFARYMRARRQEHAPTSANAVRALRTPEPETFEWEETGGYPNLYTAEVTRGAVRIRLRIIADESPDTSMYGTVEQGVRCRCDRDMIRVGRYSDICPYCKPSADSFLVTWTDYNSGREEVGWYTPDEGYEYRATYDFMQARGYSRQESDLEARRSRRCGWDTLKKFLEDQYQSVGVEARAYVGDDGVGRASVWGIECDGRDFSYLNVVAAEEIAQACDDEKIRRALDARVLEAERELVAAVEGRDSFAEDGEEDETSLLYAAHWALAQLNMRAQATEGRLSSGDARARRLLAVALSRAHRNVYLGSLTDQDECRKAASL